VLFISVLSKSDVTLPVTSVLSKSDVTLPVTLAVSWNWPFSSFTAHLGVKPIEITQ
jgi:hypothetical protein